MISRVGIVILAMGAVLSIAPAALATDYTCMPRAVTYRADPGKTPWVEVSCGIRNAKVRGGYPIDGSDEIKSFAISTSDVAMAKRLSTVAEVARTAGLMLVFSYAPGATSTFCSGSCRVPYSFLLYRPGVGRYE